MLNSFLLKLVAFLLPTQLGLHFWPDFSRVLGLKVDYLSPTFYFIYVPLLVLHILNFKTIKNSYLDNRRNTYLFLTLITSNLLFSDNFHLSLFKWLEVFFYLNTYLILSKVKNLWLVIKNPLVLSFYFVFLLQLLQLFTQSSLNGFFYYFGERAFTPSTPSIPKTTFLDFSLVRPLSTFSHPNSLAGFLSLLLGLFYLKKVSFTNKALTFFSLLLTFSKAGIASVLLVFSKPYKVQYLPLLLLTIGVLFPFINLKLNIPSFDSRIDGYRQSQNVFFSNFSFGTGLGGYIPGLAKTLPGSQITPNNLQPVHNLSLLILSEVGLVGVLLLVILFTPFRLKKEQRLLLCLVLFTSVFDHYWLTLIQNKLLLTTALSLYPLQYKHETLSSSSN